MKIKELVTKIRSIILSHNRFVPEEDEYDDDDDNELNNPQQCLKEQLFSTRLYILLLTLALLVVILFLVFYPQTLIQTISNPSISTYKQLFDQYSNTLSCPCSNITILYEKFVSVKYLMHPLCSFINDDWILAFYFRNSTHFLRQDFRRTASAQFQIIQQLCSTAKETIVNEVITSLNRTYLISSHVLIEDEVFESVNSISESIRSTTAVSILRALSLISVTIKSNYLVSGLLTNYDITLSLGDLFTASIFQYIHLSEESSCNCEEFTCLSKGDVGFFNDANIELIYPIRPIGEENNRVSGFVSSCTALDAVLMADFTCFYSDTCLNLLLNYFPHLTKEMLFNASSMRSQIEQKKNLSELIQQLFITNWSISIDYHQYFQQCSPKSCSYTYKENTNILYAFTKLLSIYGGLTFILRFITPKTIIMIMRKRQHQVRNQSERKNIFQFFRNLKSKLMKLNLFKTADRNEIVIHQQRWTTRIYLIVLFICLMISLIFYASRQQLMIISVESPSFDSYQSLVSTTKGLHCPCSQINTNYGNFISFSPSFHQICNSIFIKDIWLIWIYYARYFTQAQKYDWRSESYAMFSILPKLCELSNSTVYKAIDRFQEQIFVSIRLLEEEIFNSTWNLTINEFIRSIETNFAEAIYILRTLTHVDQLMSRKEVNAMVKRAGTSQINIFLQGPTNPYSSSRCICALDSQCEIPLSLWTLSPQEPYFLAQGFVQRCYATESLLFSTFECLYSNNAECLSTLIEKSLSTIFLYTDETPLLYNISVEPLNSSLPNRFLEKDDVLTILSRLMVEKWSENISYRKYFNICAPKQCNYRQIQSSRIIDIITNIISIYGGLSIVLHLILPQIIKIFIKTTPMGPINQPTDRHVSFRIQNIFSNIIKLIRDKIINLNIIPLRSFGNIDRDNAKRLGRITTRFYLFILAVSLTTFGLYTFVQYQIFTKTIDKPSIRDYQQWLDFTSQYGFTLDCPCSITSMAYKNFLEIEFSFNQICSSHFVENEWRRAFIKDINLQSYRIEDYRRFIPAHLNLLSDLCEISISHTNKSISSLLSSYFITTQLLTEDMLNSSLNSFVNEAYRTISTTFVRHLILIRTMLHGNRLVSAYETNYKFFKPINLHIPFVSKPMNYTTCSCDLQMNCTSPTMFKGLHIGCLPSESLFVSTLECFYDNECLTLMKSQLPNGMNTNVIIQPLNSLLPSRYSWNETIVDDLVKNLFIETWTTSINYRNYFNQCSPSQCTYTYVKQANLFYSITAVISLSSGLIVVSQWFCPILIKIVWKVIRRRYNNAIGPQNLQQ